MSSRKIRQEPSLKKYLNVGDEFFLGPILHCVVVEVSPSQLKYNWEDYTNTGHGPLFNNRHGLTPQGGSGTLSGNKLIHFLENYREDHRDCSGGFPGFAAGWLSV